MQISSLNMSKLPSQVSATAPAQKTEADALHEQEMREAATRFEASFIAQMLTHSGFAKALVSDGGKGAEAFSSLYVEQFAEGISQNGGFGLAERIYQQLTTYEAGQERGSK